VIVPPMDNSAREMTGISNGSCMGVSSKLDQMSIPKG